MTNLIAIPVVRMTCKVWIEKVKAWSAIDELLLWSIARRPKTVEELLLESQLPLQVIIASASKMMRFRLVEVILQSAGMALQVSDYGSSVVKSGEALPSFPKRFSRRVSFVVELATGGMYQTREVGGFKTRANLQRESEKGTVVQYIEVQGDSADISHEANFDRLSEISARGWGEELAGIEAGTVSTKEGFIVVRVDDGVPDVPDVYSPSLKDVIAGLELGLKESASIIIPTFLREKKDPAMLDEISCGFEADDVVIGGESHKDCFLSILAGAKSRLIIHSTFLDSKKFQELVVYIRAACMRGVTLDILWGADEEDEDESGIKGKNATAASEIMRIVVNDRDLNSKVKVHMVSTGSHSKFLIADNQDDNWVAVVGSCNWLSSPFQSVELSVVLRDLGVVSKFASAVQGLLGVKGFVSSLANEMAIVARDLERRPKFGGNSTVSIVLGESHDYLMRKASGTAVSELVIGSNKLGSTVRPAAVIPGESAAQRSGIVVSIIYDRLTGPIKNRHIKQLAEEAIENGVRLIKTDRARLHGKFLAWDADHLVITSLNWASASVDVGFPWGEMGVYVNSPGVATKVLDRLREVFSELP
ncbi:PLDc_2 domain-containing protein [Pseudomonas sp. IT-P2]|uniref:phospholipase D-like domain-containing protein n=1 Tax=Pseudomonas sp. IT-P2 TaxID=3026456 RepID=UPI0039E09EC8